MLVAFGICSLAGCPLIVLFFIGAGCHRNLDADLIEQADVLANIDRRRHSDWWIPSTPSMRH